jgi:hypothetical protein
VFDTILTRSWGEVRFCFTIHFLHNCLGLETQAVNKGVNGEVRISEGGNVLGDLEHLHGFVARRQTLDEVGGKPRLDELTS